MAAANDPNRNFISISKNIFDRDDIEETEIVNKVNTEPQGLTKENVINKFKNLTFIEQPPNQPGLPYNPKRIHQSQNLQRILESREEFQDRVRLTSNPDGTTTAEFYIKPTLYIDNTGTQLPIDTSIEQSMDSNLQENYKFQSIKNNLKVRFRENYSPGTTSNLIYLNEPGNQYPVYWQPLKISIELLNTPLSSP